MSLRDLRRATAGAIKQHLGEAGTYEFKSGARSDIRYREYLSVEILDSEGGVTEYTRLIGIDRNDIAECKNGETVTDVETGECFQIGSLVDRQGDIVRYEAVSL